jgi:quercetin dioxygenase-like cupin family protein
MIVVDSSSVDTRIMSPEDDPIVAKALVSGRKLLSVEEAGGWAASLTTFGAGGRLNWHTHDSEQILYVTEGQGIVATKEREQVITPGCIVFIPAGEVHWHGAASGMGMTHLNVQKAGIHLAE